VFYLGDVATGDVLETLLERRSLSAAYWRRWSAPMVAGLRAFAQRATYLVFRSLDRA
jgi:hypothetical protein